MKTARVGLDCLPDTNRIVVISGKSVFDQLLENRAREELGQTFQGVTIEYWSGRPLAFLENGARSLPDRTIVLFLSSTIDIEGNVYVSADVVQKLATVSRVPICMA